MLSYSHQVCDDITLNKFSRNSRKSARPRWQRATIRAIKWYIWHWRDYSLLINQVSIFIVSIHVSAISTSDLGQQTGKDPEVDIPFTEIMHCMSRNADMDWVTRETLLVEAAPTCREIYILLTWPSLFFWPWFKYSCAITETYNSWDNGMWVIDLN